MAKEHLTPWKPGQSGNPRGRPKGVFSLTEEMKKYLAEKELDEDGKPTGRTNARAFIELVVEKAADGNPEALKQVINRLEGPVPTESKVDVTSAGKALGVAGLIGLSVEQLERIANGSEGGDSPPEGESES